MHLYVYYDVARADVEQLVDAVASMQRELSGAATDLPHARLMRRAERADDRETWMEVYEDVPDGFEERLDQAVRRRGLAARTGPRHVERFVPVAPCA